jgi:hypothetical protein
MTVQQKGRGVEDHSWVMSVTREEREEPERVIGNKEKGLNG